jgi:hypothetical protein
MSHFTLTILLALLVSVTAVAKGMPARRQVYRTAWMFACCMGSVISGSWAMYFIHG